MTTEVDFNESNPYRSPEAACGPTAQPIIVASGHFRWRVFPVCLLYLFGAFLVVGGTVVFGIGLWRLGHDRSSAREMASCMMVLPGALFLYAGRSLWRGPIWRGMLVTVLAIAVYAGAAAVLVHFGWS